MTLQAFLQRVALAPPESLRRAMTAALSMERPASPESFVRFYQRVVSELDRSLSPPHRTDDPAERGGARAA